MLPESVVSVRSWVEGATLAAGSGRMEAPQGRRIPARRIPAAGITTTVSHPASGDRPPLLLEAPITSRPQRGGKPLRTASLRTPRNAERPPQPQDQEGRLRNH